MMIEWRFGGLVVSVEMDGVEVGIHWLWELSISFFLSARIL